MSYRTILVHVDDSTHLEKRVEIAATIARHENARLIGVAPIGTSRTRHSPVLATLETERADRHVAEDLDESRQRAAAALEQFETQIRKTCVTSYEARLIEGEPASGIAKAGADADLIILGQSDADDPYLTASVDFPEYVVLNSRCPVLIVPRSGRVFTIGERVLIAWNASQAAAHAVRDAMPFLQQAKSIHAAIIDPPSGQDPRGQGPEGDIVAYLAGYNVKAEVVRCPTKDKPGHALLALVTDITSDLIVMGCVAHPRSRGAMLGGTTRVILESATVPVLMSR